VSATNEHGLTPQQDLFAREVARGRSQAEAYRMAYPKSRAWKEKTLHPRASTLMSNSNVATRVATLQKAAADEVVVDRNRLLREMLRLALADPRGLVDAKGDLKNLGELDDDIAAAVASVEVDKDGKLKYRLWDKGAAQEKLAKFLGLYREDNRQQSDPLRALASAILGRTVGPDGLALGDG